MIIIISRDTISDNQNTKIDERFRWREQHAEEFWDLSVAHVSGMRFFYWVQGGNGGRTT